MSAILELFTFLVSLVCDQAQPVRGKTQHYLMAQHGLTIKAQPLLFKMLHHMLLSSVDPFSTSRWTAALEPLGKETTYK